jgi:hypothetical protein
MKRKFTPLLITVLLLVLVFQQTQLVLAKRGVPGSAEFGFGATIYPDGPHLTEALTMAASLNLDWLRVPVAWSSCGALTSAVQGIAGVDTVVQFASQKQISVLLYVSSAPDCARAAQGPDPERTAQFVLGLAQRYPTVQAIELFPGANTLQGWGAKPNAQAYTALFRIVRDRLNISSRQVLLVAAGLQPLAGTADGRIVDDLTFLREMYQHGAAELMPVISLQFVEVNGSPLDAVETSKPGGFRRYELIREIMQANNHQSGRIWVTHLSPPSGKIKAQQFTKQDLLDQSAWVTQAYILLRSQLYVGAAFLQSLNTDPNGTAGMTPRLIQEAGLYHPLYAALGEMIELNHAGSTSIKPGKSKDGNLWKNRP